MNDWPYNHSFPIAFVVAVVVLALFFQSWLILHLLRQHGRILVRMDDLEAALKEKGVLAAAAQAQPGLPSGTPAPSFELPLLSGEMTNLGSLCAAGRPVLLIFSDPRCNPCNALLPDIARWVREEATKLTIVLISRGSAEANRAKIASYGLKNVLLQQEGEISETFYAQGTPSAVLILSNGLIGSPVVMGAQAIGQLVAHATGKTSRDSGPTEARNGNHQHPNQNGLRLGQTAPAFRLTGLDEKPVGLDAFKGRDTLLLFWNPNCGFCKSMLSDLKEWEKNRPEGAPELLVISTGTVESNRAMQLEATVLLDQGFAVGPLFGVAGTPSAVLVDSDGRIRSTLAVGAPAVLNLAYAADPLSTSNRQ